MPDAPSIATFVLASTSAPGTKAGKALLAAGLARAGRRPAKESVVVIGAAHDDDQARLGAIRRALERDIEGASVVAPRLTDPGLDVEAAREALARASVVYLDGGDTLVLVQAARERGLERDLVALAARDVLIYGLSAGACAASPFTIGYGADERGHVAACLALGVPWPCDVHDEADDWPEMRALLELRPAGARGLVIPAGAAALVSRGEASALAGAPELRALDARGAWTVEGLPRA